MKMHNDWKSKYCGGHCVALFMSEKFGCRLLYYLNRHAEFDGDLWVLGTIGLDLFPLNVECASFIMVYEEQN